MRDSKYQKHFFDLGGVKVLSQVSSYFISFCSDIKYIIISIRFVKKNKKKHKNNIF